MARAGAVGLGQIELRFHGRWLQRNSFLQFADGLIGVGRNEGCTQVGVSVSVIRLDTNCLTERRDGRFVIIGLCQH